MAKNKSSINIKYTCLGASRQVTGSCHYLKINILGKDYGIVVDLGQVQNGLMKLNELYNTNKQEKSIDWENVVGVVLSHAHS
jgi:predicted metal-dependent RNase